MAAASSNRRRTLAIVALGIVLIATLLLWPRPNAGGEPGEDHPCMAARFGLPCRT